jgi:GGDEF domain-containing protein
VAFDGPILTRALIEEAAARLFKAEGESSRTLPQEMLRDSLVHQLGNHLAFQQFEDGLKDMTFVLINLDDVGVVNESYGVVHGDRYIQVAGELLAKLCRTFEGEGFRLHGDTFLFCFYKPEHAQEFLRDAGEEFKEMVPMGAYGQPSFAAGIGVDMSDAEEALEKAKVAKREYHGDIRLDSGADVGHGICYCHTNLGYGGSIPVSEEPEIPEQYITPKTTLPMELRPEVELAAEGAAAVEPVAKSERSRFAKGGRPSQAPDFAREVQDDVP